MKSDLSTYASTISPNKNVRNQPITKITIHHMAGNVDADEQARRFSYVQRQASSNYCISGKKIVCCVPEEYRAWTSGSRWNDFQAITIEVANSTGKPTYEISKDSYDSLIRLCADICKRYNIEPCFNGTKNASFTFHYMFHATECPGPYIKANIQNIIKDIKAVMQGGNPEPVKPEPEKPAASYLVKVTANCLNIRSGPGTKYKAVGQITDHGIYTIVETSGTWGKLKSGAGWISLRYTKEV